MAAGSSAMPTPRSRGSYDAIARLMFDGLSPAYRRLLLERARVRIPEHPPVALCFSPGTPNDVINAFQNAMFPNPAQRFQGSVQWGTTATNGGGLQRGEPITLTYSFVPDGTSIPGAFAGDLGGLSNLFAALDNLYGDTAVWQDLYAQVFARWSQLCGITYVREANDDGAPFPNSPGLLGVRGDLRMAGRLIDGNPIGGSILAFNFFPDSGDMVIDTADAFFNNTSGNSLRLRNVLGHEHGHGMGQEHVCPLTRTKLMEPIATIAFDGPQHDDIRGAQWRYGDPFEPDNTPAAATDVGTLASGASLTIGEVPPPSVDNGSVLSIDASGEQDYFRFTTTGPVKASVVLRPIGLIYDDSIQSAFKCPDEQANCCSGSFTNSENVGNLNVQIIDTNGITVLATAASQSAGAAETLTNVILPTPGEYFLRVFTNGSLRNPQLYTLDLGVNFQALQITLPSGPPATLLSGEATPFDVQIASNDDTIVPGSETLFFRYGNGAFQSAALMPVGGEMYTATLPPADCRDKPQFYVSADGALGGNLTEPAGGASDPLEAFVITGPDLLFADNFQADQGWTVSGDATDGQWERGVPVNSNRGDPPSDQDGSGQAFVTDNTAGDSDVENGTTILTSPAFDLSDGGTISYAYWLNDAPSLIPPGERGDSLTVEIATDPAGTIWQQIREYTQFSPGWRTDSIIAPPSPTLRVRYSAKDLLVPSVIEAGIDAVRVNRIKCVPPAPTGLTASDAAFCNLVRLSWDDLTEADDYQVWRGVVDDPSAATQIADNVVGTTFDDDTAPAEATLFYWIKAVGGTGPGEFSDSDPGSTLRGEPAAPTGLVATEQTICGGVVLAWDPVDKAQNYEVWRRSVEEDPPPAVRIASDVLGTAFTDKTAAAGQMFHYWARAVNACGSGEFSEAALGSTSTTAPRSPTGLSASDGTVCGSVVLRWDKLASAATYQVWQNTVNDSASAMMLGSTKATFFIDDTADPNVTFYYWVAAENGCGVSGLSEPDQGTAGIDLLDCPGPAGAPLSSSKDCGEGLCGPGMGMVISMMLAGCWFIRKRRRSSRAARG